MCTPFESVRNFHEAVGKVVSFLIDLKDRPKEMEINEKVTRHYVYESGETYTVTIARIK